MDPLRNFDLTVDEIRLVKSIDQLKEALDNIQMTEPLSSRASHIRREIHILEEKLEELRENTLIR